MNDRRPFQISLKGLFALTLFAAFSFWLASGRRNPNVLLGCYLFLGFVQISLSYWIYRNIVPFSEERPDRRQVVWTLIACLSG